MNSKSGGEIPHGAHTFRLSRKHPGLNRLQQWVASNGALKLTLEQAAEIAALEAHYFSVAFHRHVGQSFLEWRRKYRAEVAVHLIRSGGRHGAEITRRGMRASLSVNGPIRHGSDGVADGRADFVWG